MAACILLPVLVLVSAYRLVRPSLPDAQTDAAANDYFSEEEQIGQNPTPSGFTRKRSTIASQT